MDTHLFDETAWFSESFADASHVARKRGMKLENVSLTLRDCKSLCLDAKSQVLTPNLTFHSRASRSDHLIHARRVFEHKLPGVWRGVAL
jgi:hypothetical protein